MRAALARLQKEIALNGHDVAVVSREKNGEVTIREAIDLNGKRVLHEAFWKTLAGRLFMAPPDGIDSGEPPLTGLASIGIDDRFIADVENTVVPGMMVSVYAAGTVRFSLIRICPCSGDQIVSRVSWPLGGLTAGASA